MTDPHPLIGQIKTAIGPGPLMDCALALCDDMECHTCGAICCPYGDAYHFHHDGCPTCAQVSGGAQASEQDDSVSSIGLGAEGEQ